MEEKSLATVISKISEALNIAVDKHGVEAVKVLMETTQLMAINDVIQSIVALIIGGVFIVYALRRGFNFDVEREFVSSIGRVFGMVASILFVLTAISTLINPITWKSIDEPKYYIAYSLLKKGFK
jgi:hypothetical protein